MWKLVSDVRSRSDRTACANALNAPGSARCSAMCSAVVVSEP